MFAYQSTACRCRKCRARRTLKRHPDNYIKIPRCYCGSNEWVVDAYRMNKEYLIWRSEKCDCPGYSFPHRRTGGWCFHNPKRNFNDEHEYDEFVKQHQ